MGSRRLAKAFSYFFVLSFTFVSPESALTIKKCCSAEKTLNDNLQCVKIPEEIERKEFDWFPLPAIIDGQTENISNDNNTERHLKMLRKAKIVFGEKPHCHLSEMDATTFNVTDKQFHFILIDGDMKVRVNSKKTLHHPRRGHDFPSGSVENSATGSGRENELSSKDKPRAFPMKSVCVDALLGRNYHAMFICPCEYAVCIRKCCRDGEYFDEAMESCTSAGNRSREYRWRPNFKVLSWMKFVFLDMSLCAIVSATFTLLIAVCAENGTGLLQINKCCPRNQMLDEKLDCVEIDPEEGKPTDSEVWKRKLFWFPIETVVDSKTLKIHEHRSDKYLKMIETKYGINYGVRPQCTDSDAKQFAYHRANMVEWFNFVVYEGDAMKIHISKPSSFHSPENILLFSKTDNDTEEYPNFRDEGSVRSLPLEDACVDLGIHQIHVLMFCPCHTMLCVRKCCAENHYFSIESFGCEKKENDMGKIQNWRPIMDDITDNYYLLSDTYPSCETPILLKYHHEEYSSCNRFNRASDNEFTIFPNGSLKVRKYSTLFDTTQYCGEVTVSKNGTIEKQNLILCSASKKEEDAFEPITHTLYGVLLIVGGICLFLTVIVSLYLPSLRRKVHNKIALSHNASLMVANFTWAVPQLSTGLSPRSCIILAFLEQFMLLGSFFWLNVMCIDISLTFSSNRHLKRGGLDGGTKKFLYYCIYAWGMTSVVSTITLAMEYSTDAKLDYLKPGFACICGFNTANASMLLYLYGPMTILLLVNLTLFIYTTAKIMSIQKQTAMLHKTDSNTTGGSSFQTDKQRYDLIQWLILYGKLFLLMGVTWIMEIISWAVGGPSYYWYFSDILNLLRAVFIFILFICKKQVLRNLKKKWKKKVRGFSDKTGSGKSQTDEEAVSSTAQTCTGTGRRKESGKSEMEQIRNGRNKPCRNPSIVKESQM